MIKKCPICGKTFEGRRDKQTCSPKCRVAKSRREDDKDTLAGLYKSGRDAVFGLSMMMGSLNEDTRRGAKARLKSLGIELLSNCPEDTQEVFYKQLRELYGAKV